MGKLGKLYMLGSWEIVKNVEMFVLKKKEKDYLLGRGCACAVDSSLLQTAVIW